jgi:hypothetical protein
MKELKKRRDPDLMDNPDWIPGIYNYCDRWCERCAFTGKCRSFAMEIRESGVEANAQPEPDTLAHDIRSKEFWEELGITLNLTMEYLRKLELNEGDESEVMNDQQWDKLRQKDQEIEQAAMKHPVAIAAWKYSELTESWILENQEVINWRTIELEKQIALDAGAKRATVEIGLINDALQIIRWYEPQIWVKLMRALTGRIGEEEPEAEPKDSDGSAKVALISMDRSLAAWGQLQFIFPDMTDDFITILLHLDRLRRQVEAEFSHARSFKRAGFDDAQE